MSTLSTPNNCGKLNDVQQQMQRIYNEAVGFAPKDMGEDWRPTIDIYETEGDLVLQSELPGMQEADFKIKVENNVLTLTGERKLAEKQRFKVYRQERPAGNFERSFTLPSNYDVTQIKASYNNGLLNISLPKKAEARPRQIDIKIR